MAVKLVSKSLILAVLSVGLVPPISAATPMEIGTSGMDSSNQAGTTDAAVNRNQAADHSAPASGTEHGEPVSSSEPYSSRLLRTSSDPINSRVLFIPEKILKTTPVEELPISQGSREDLERLLGGWAQFQEKVQDERGVTLERCSHAVGHLQEGALQDASSLEDQILHVRGVSFIGKVVTSVLGWHTSLRKVRTMVYVEVTEVLRDTREQLVAGDILAFELDTGGRIELSTGTLCTIGPPDIFSPQAGDEILVSADHSNMEDYVYALIVCPIREGVLYPPQSGHLKSSEPQALRTLRQAVETSRSGDLP